MKKTLYLIICLAIAAASYGQGYNKKTIKAIKKALGNDVGKFKFFSYPTDNYGVLTSYRTRESDLTRICATWSCIGVEYDQVPTDLKEWINVQGFVDTGRGAQKIELTQEVKNDLSVNTVLPKIFDVLSVEGGFDKSSVVSTDLRIGQGYKRSLNIDKVRQAFATSSNQTLRAAFDEGKLAYIIADVVIESMSVTIKVNSATAAKIEAKLAGLPSAVITDASLNLSYSRGVAGEYTFVFTNPVVVARLAKKQPQAEMLESKTDATSWPDAKNLPDESALKGKANTVTKGN